MEKRITIFAWIIFIVSRLFFFSKLPIFEDEAQYLYLADSIVNNPSDNLFIYLHNGLLPMFGWIVALGTLIYDDSLTVGRMINVVLASSLIFWTYYIGRLYGKSLTFFITAYLLIIISPILQLNSGVALLDVSIAVFTSWYIYFTLKIIIYDGSKSSKLDFIGLFFSLTAALLTKATGTFGVLVLVVWILLGKHKKKLNSSKIAPVGIIYATSIAIMLMFYVPYAGQISSDSGSSLITNMNVQDVLNKIEQNFWLTLHWVKIYYESFVIVILIYFLFRKRIKHNNIYLLMGLWTVVSLALMVVLNRFYFPRHILMINMPIIILVAATIASAPRKIGITALIVISFSRLLLTNSIFSLDAKTNMAQEDWFEYYENYTSGKNIATIAKEIRSNLDTKQGVVYIDGSYVMEYGLRRELKSDKNIEFKSFRLGNEFLLPHKPEKVIKDPSRDTYVILNRWRPENMEELSLVKGFDVSFRHTQYLYKVKY